MSPQQHQAYPGRQHAILALVKAIVVVPIYERDTVGKRQEASGISIPPSIIVSNNQT